MVIAIRQSPDWAALADDFAAGRAIDPARYAPPRPIPGFPADIVDLVARWNAFSAVDFFTVRRRLKELAQATLRRVARAVVLPCSDLAAALPDLRHDSALLFFSDDDDWFAPHLADVVSPRDFAGADVVVFPLVRLGREQTCTFVHPAFPPRAAIGRMHPLPQRYNTNNYGLTPSLWRQRHVAAMQDHFDASAHGERMRLTDRYLPEIIGVTSKTPCAASFLLTAVQSPAAFAEALGYYVREVRSYAIPDDLGWMREPLAATVALFEDVLARAAATAP